MAEKVPNELQEIADLMGAKVVGQLPHVGGGAFGAARLAEMFALLQERLQPGKGKRPGRPTVADWKVRTKVPMTRKTARALTQLAQQASEGGKRVTPTQVAAQLLEEAVAKVNS